MDYISKFDIEIDRDVYYAGEKLTGHIVVQNSENLKVQGIRLTLRGKVHIEWKIMRTGERRTVKQDHYYVDDKTVIWGKDKNEEGSVPILPRGNHRYPFQFQLPESALPCSFESKIATVRYYLRVVIDMPYASSPQGVKYFTIIGPHIDCMDERYLTPQEAQDKNNNCCFCCGSGPLVLKATLDRSAYCCGENIRLKAEIHNNSDENVWLVCRFTQYVQFFINKGVLGLNKDTSHKVFEVESQVVAPGSVTKVDDLSPQLQVPVMPPTMINVCQNIEIFYSLKVFLHMEKSGDTLHIEFPITIGTVPFRIPNSPSPEVRYENAVSHVEGGIYISSEFQFGGVYMGDEEDQTTEEVVLYRPVYVCVPHAKVKRSDTPSSSSKDNDNKKTKKEEEEELKEEKKAGEKEGDDKSQKYETQKEGEELKITTATEAVTVETKKPVDLEKDGGTIKKADSKENVSTTTTTTTTITKEIDKGIGEVISKKMAKVDIESSTANATTTVGKESVTIESVELHIVGDGGGGRVKVDGGGGDRSSSGSGGGVGGGGDGPSIEDKIASMTLVQQRNSTVNTNAAYTATSSSSMTKTSTTTAASNNLSQRKSEVSNASVKSWNLEEHSEESKKTTTTTKTITTTAETGTIQKEKKVNASEEECKTESLPKENSESINIAPT
ncbi:uncharacterized protein LOC115223663 [Argonauta hians]